MKVVKFGGTSLASATQIKKVCEIINADPARKIVAVSAPGKRHRGDIKVTDLLIAAARARLSGKSGEKELRPVVERFAEIAADLELPPERMEPIAADLRERLAGNKNKPGKFEDNLKAAGEDNCAKLVAEYLRARGRNARYVSPQKRLFLSDEPGNARVLRRSYGKLRALREDAAVSVFPGFFGYSEKGEIVTFPRGGTDITGAVLAAATEADLYENFTDVDYVFVADPSIVEDPKPVTEITYREMRELSYAGFEVLHNEALEPVFRAGVPVAVKNTNNPTAPGTRIVTERDVSNAPVVGIAATGGFCSVFVDKYLMNREIGFGCGLLKIFEDEEVPFEHTPSGIDNMSVVLREKYFSKAVEARVLRRIRTELAADRASVRRGLALVMIVGEGMFHSVGLAARACGAFSKAGVNIEMINQGASEVSMMFGIHIEDIAAAVRSLYDEFFG